VVSFQRPSLVEAAGNTSTDSDPGQVRANTRDGILYLTTTVNQREQQTNTTSRTALADASTGTTAQAAANPTGEAVSRPMGFAEDLGSYINAILSLVIVVSLLLVFFNFIMAGFQWITSGGDKGKTEEARNKIVNAVIGILIVSSSFAVAGFVAYILGFESFNDAMQNVSRINPA
jgi:hypothetical protein